MKTTLKLLLLFIALLAAPVYAQDEDDPGNAFEDEYGNTDDTMEAPVSDYIGLMAGAAVVLGLYATNRMRKQQRKNNRMY